MPATSFNKVGTGANLSLCYISFFTKLLKTEDEVLKVKFSSILLLLYMMAVAKENSGSLHHTQVLTASKPV